MNRWMIVIIKAFLTTLSTVTILLSAFLMCLIFDLTFTSGMPPIENLKFSVALFFVIILLVFICLCLKTHLDISIDSRNQSSNKIH
ncbi:hypothetical protein CBW53_05985 [Yersinia frederiksenii]|nr:hypothetical protein CBW53_05985 [Yersinia frederiksenii]CNI28732.1 Uncharacterised protein [Yersinia frederiksenii]